MVGQGSRRAEGLETKRRRVRHSGFAKRLVGGGRVLAADGIELVQTAEVQEPRH